jgi:hypothetical protein
VPARTLRGRGLSGGGVGTVLMKLR